MYGANSNTFYKTTGSAFNYDGDVWSTEGYTRGCYVSSKLTSTANDIVFGLSDNPTVSGIAFINYAFHVDTAGGLSILELGTTIAISGNTYTTSTVF